MKKTCHFLFFLTILSLTACSSATKYTTNFNKKDSIKNPNKCNFTKDFTNRNNDPRIYTKVFNIKDQEKKIIWKYSEDENLSNKKTQIIDAQSIIQIEFCKEELSKNINFKGNITIEGKIVNSDGGQAPIQVYPYSMIGEDKINIGTANRAPNEISTTFVNLLIESYEAILNKDEFIPKLKTIIDYISYFRSSGKSVESAFLSFTSLDRISLKNIEVDLKNIADNIDLIIASKSQNDKIKLLRTYDYSQLMNDSKIQLQYEKALIQLRKLTQIKGTFIYETLFEKSYSKHKEKSIRDELIKDKDTLVNSISIKASEVIYRDLDYATIDLKEERAKEGDYLYLYVVQYLNSDSKPNSKIEKEVLPIGRYELRNTKWQVKIADSFLLIDRINQPDTSLDANKDVSPSNFKGAPGASLLLTWRRDGSKENKLINFLEPSFGVNVSYVDFSRNDDVEIGAGLILGLFNNKIFFSGGINLNSTGNDESNPYYFGVGFSFANLVGKLIKK